MADPKEGYNSGVNRNVTGTLDSDGDFLARTSGFTPSDYDTDLTMNGTAQGVVLASSVKLGQGSIHVVNQGATTEAIRIAFGTSELNAEANLNHSSDHATTGFYLSSVTDSDGTTVLAVPATSTHYAIENAVASDTQVVSVTQGK